MGGMITPTMTAPALLKQEQAHATKLKEVRAELARAEKERDDLAEAVEWVCEVADYHIHRLSGGEPPSRAWGELQRSVTQARRDLDCVVQRVRGGACQNPTG